jgi:hypothetical protein
MSREAFGSRLSALASRRGERQGTGTSRRIRLRGAHWASTLAFAGFFVGAQPAAAQAPPEGPAQTAPPVEPAAWYKQLSVNGLVSASYVGNFESPPSGTNQFRVFDTRSGTFALDVVELVVQRSVSSPGEAGFRVDLTFGSLIPKVTAAAGLFRDENGVAGDFDLQQAYFSYVAPAGRGLRIDAGKFATHLGYEVIEGYDGYNDNHSHSFLFGYAQPITHTGLRISYPFSAAVSAQVHLVNGWDNAVDNNTGKSIGAQLALTPSPRLSVLLNYMGGPEQADENSNLRHAFDLVATFKAAAALSLAVNYDYGQESSVALPETSGGGRADVSWQGVAGYGRVTLSPRVALVLRAEWFDDRQGARTGSAQSLKECTFTPEFKPHPHVVVRADLRHDWSDREVFETGDGRLGRSQTTLSVNGIFVF